jgi:hypothetical protein
MATDSTDMLPSFFWGNSPNVNQQLRQRIALQMMGQGKGKGYPKNIGEGLTAIGDSLGDIGMARMLERGDLGQQAAAQRDAASLMGGDQPAAYAPPDRAVTPPPAAADTSAVLPQQPAARVPLGIGGFGQRYQIARETIVCVGHFAVDDQEVRFCTHLQDKASWFLPFN